MQHTGLAAVSNHNCWTINSS